jgi:hypothetical protein
MNIIYKIALILFLEPQSQNEYIIKYYPVAKVCEYLYGVPTSIQLAQALAESGGGVSYIGKYSNNHFGSFPTNSLQTVDLHCINVASINTANTAMIANTRVGSARIKEVLYDTASNTSNSSTYEYRTYLFDLAVNDNVVSNVVSTTNLSVGSNVVIHGSLLSPIVDAYKGAKFRISTGLGSVESVKTITAWNPSTKTLTLDKGFLSVSTPNTASVVSIDFEIGQIKSLINFSSTTKLCSADVAQRSKDPSYTYDTTYISDSNFEPLIMRVGEEYIKQNKID